MGAFNSAVITAKGQALLAKVVAGTTELQFTRIATSENVLSGDLASKTSIGTEKQSASVSSITRVNETNVKVSTGFTNELLVAGYYVRNIGLYATDPQEEEILYSISVADESTATADWMPPYNNIGVSSLLVDLITAVSNASSVVVEVDPTAIATVSQIVDLQEQIDEVKTFVGCEGDDVYGVEVDYENKQFTRLAGAEGMVAGTPFDALDPWGNRKRCNLTDSGVVLAYYGDEGFSETGATTMAITKDGTEYASGTKVQVMVEQPVFYVKVVPVKTKTATSGRGKELLKARYYLTSTPKAGFEAPRGFKDARGVVQDKIYLSAYEGSIFDVSANAYLLTDQQVGDFTASTGDKFCSISGAKPASGLSQNLTRANVRKICNNRGEGWQSHNIYALAITQWLFLIEYASMDTQLKIGRGVCDFTDDGATNMAVNTGATSALGNSSGMPTGGVNGQCSVSYRGEENLWGNIWTWLDLINILAKGVNEAYLQQIGGTIADDTTTGYDNYGAQLAHANGYQSAVGYSEEYPDVFLPTAVAGTSSLPIGDYFYQNYTYNGFLIARLGGIWDGGSGCGAWCLYVVTASSGRVRYFGGRLLYVPQTRVA